MSLVNAAVGLLCNDTPAENAVKIGSVATLTAINAASDAIVSAGKSHQLQSVAYGCATQDIPKEETKIILDNKNQQYANPLKDKDVQSALELGYLQYETDEAGRKILETRDSSGNFDDSII